MSPTLSPSFLPSLTPTTTPSESPTLVASQSPTLLPGEPMTPRLISAMFSNDGSSFRLVFDAPTDKGGRVNAFTCTALLAFPGDIYAECQWTSSMVITVRPFQRPEDPENIVTVGSSILLKMSNGIRAFCTAAKETCGTWRTSASQTLTLSTPESPVTPVVAVSGPSAISGCSTYSFDLGASSGSGGRGWSSVRFEVSAEGDSSAASLLEEFLNLEYTLSPPKEVPNSVLTGGESYSIQVELCNFLGACGSRQVGLLVMNSSDAIPSVFIPGASSRSIRRSSTFKLSARAYKKSCSGHRSTSGLSFSWQVLQRDHSTNILFVNESLLSVAKDPTRFCLTPFSLSVDTEYEVRVIVTDVVTRVNSSSVVSVTVPRANVRAVVTGTNSRSMVVGGTLSIDASGSYDQDVSSLTGARAGLSFSWSCVRVSPAAGDCPLTFESETTTEEVLVLSAAEASRNSTSLVSLLVTGGAGRNDSLQVLVTVLDPAAPLVTITTASNTVEEVNVGRKLLLSGSVNTSVPCAAEWRVDDPELNLTTASLVPITSLASAGSTLTTNLYLAAQTLSIQSTYVFSLFCGDSVASITVSSNQPPSGGVFLVSPDSGTELTTEFSFSTSQWYDSHMPLSYEFGLLSPSLSVGLTLHGRSQMSSLSSTLPAGTDSMRHLVNTSVSVYDSLDAVSHSYQVVVVTPASEEDIAGLVEAQLSETEGSSVDNTKQTIAILSSVLNRVDCNRAPDCPSLNRKNCSSVSQTCGACVEGFYGDRGASNTPCVSAEEASSVNSTIQLTKQCVEDCSSQGECSFIRISTGEEVSSCSLLTTDCEAVCVCFDGFAGASCSKTETQWEQALRQRSSMIFSLLEVVENDDPGVDTVESWVSGVSSLVQNRYDVSSNTTAVLRDVMDVILTNAATVEGLPFEDTIGMLSSIDAWADSTSYNNISASLSGNQESGGELVALLMKFETLVARDIVSTQAPVTSLLKNFRLASAVFEVPAEGVIQTLSSPSSDQEQLLEGERSGVSINRGGLKNSPSSVKLSTIETAAKVFPGGSSLFVSNSLHVSASGVTAVEVTLKSNIAREYRESYIGWNFTSSCTGPEDFSTSNYTCPQSGVVLTHQCRGVAGSNTSFCPVPATTCNVLNLTSSSLDIYTSGCTLLDYTETTTTCSCPIGSSTTNTRRARERKLQDVEEESGAADFVSMTTYIGNDFVGTFRVAQDFSSPAAFERALIVILMFVILWVGGCGIIFGCALRQKLLQEVVAQSQMKVQQRQRRIRQFGSQVSVYGTLSKYVEEVFPVVFGQKSYLHRMTEEIKKHHGYLTLITAPPGESGNKARVLTGCYLLTVQSMLMFLLAVFYDLQGPDDDGSCEQYRTEDACLDRKTMLDNDQTYCQWNQPTTDAYPCTYKPPYITPLIGLYIAVFVSIVTALLMYPIDIVFDLLSAPVADDDKLQAADNMMKQLSRGVNTVGSQVRSAARRASTVAANIGTSVMQNFRQAEKLKAGMPTREFPDATVSAHALAQTSIKIIEGRAEQNLLAHRRSSTKARLSIYSRHQRPSSTRGLDEPISRKTKKAADVSGEDSDSDQDSYVDSLSNESSDVESDSDSDSNTNSEKEDFGESKKDGDTLLAYRPILGANILEVFKELQEEIHNQRRLLKPSELEEFDFAWGLDPSGEFVRDEKFMGGHLRVKAGAATNITRELEHVKKETGQKVDKLSLATDVHTGLEILHLFVLDLLGRDTPAAQIFETKSAEDFKHTHVITQRTKVLAWAAVVVMNLFFAIFSVLRGYQKGVEWQRSYLLGCILQLLIEVFLFETLECVWIHFFVPNLVSNEVQRVNDLLMDTVNQLCSLTPPDSRFFLNAPDYLFVSTNVAKCFPDLVESIIVRSFHHHLPGELAKKWHLGANVVIARNNRSRRYAPLAALLTVLQSLATAPFALQRIIIRFLQPFFLGGLILMWLSILENPIYIALFSLFCFVLIVFVLYRYFKDTGKPRKVSLIKPVDPVDMVNLTPPPERNEEAKDDDDDKSDDNEKDKSSLDNEPRQQDNNNVVQTTRKEEEKGSEEEKGEKTHLGFTPRQMSGGFSHLLDGEDDEDDDENSDFSSVSEISDLADTGKGDLSEPLDQDQDQTVGDIKLFERSKQPRMVVERPRSRVGTEDVAVVWSSETSDSLYSSVSSESEEEEEEVQVRMGSPAKTIRKGLSDSK